MSRAALRFDRIWTTPQTYGTDHRGAAAAEFALVLSLLLIPLLNAADFGIYIYQAMELDDAAQAGAEAALVTCGYNGKVPAANGGCPDFLDAVTTAAHSTSLGSAVTITSISESDYCANNGNVLIPVADLTRPPADCSSTPGDYVLVTASFTYRPLFTAVSLANLFKTPITQTVWMRLE